MTRDEIDSMWQKALIDSVRDGEQFTRYHFFDMVAKHTQELCAKVCRDRYMGDNNLEDMEARRCADEIMRMTV